MRQAKTTKFLQDGAPCHKAKTIMNWLAQRKWSVVDWPGNSLDLNHIENLWNWMKNQLKDSHCSNLDELQNEIKILWQ